MRGSPNATKPYEFSKLLKFLKPKKTDVYYDLGCGYGNTCRWISKYVKTAIGIENHSYRYKIALKKTPERRYPNVKILKKNFNKIHLKIATIIYCTMDLSISDFVRIKRETKSGTRIIVPTVPPPYPIGSKRVWPFFIFKTPYKRVKNVDEYARIYFNSKNASIEEMFKDLGRIYSKMLKWQIPRAESSWKKLIG